MSTPVCNFGLRSRFKPRHSINSFFLREDQPEPGALKDGSITRAVSSRRDCPFSEHLQTVMVVNADVSELIWSEESAWKNKIAHAELGTAAIEDPMGRVD